MVRNLVFGFVILLFTSHNGYSQILVSGVVLSAKDNSPIPFVSIGMQNTTVGTISELDGTFSVNVPQRLIKQELLFSSLGFERRTISLIGMNSDTTIKVLLREKIVELKEVTVRSKSKFRRFEFGNSEYDGGSMYGHKEYAGSSIVIFVDNKFPNYSAFDFPAYLDKVSLRIVNNTFKEFKLRLRLYAVDSITGKPGKDLLNKDILIYEKIRNGWLDLKLSEYDIRIGEPFYVGFEWILDAKDRAFLHRQYTDWYSKHPELVTQDFSRIGSTSVSYSNYNGTMWAGTSFGVLADPEKVSKFQCYYRYNSFGEWFVSPAALCLRVVMAI